MTATRRTRLRGPFLSARQLPARLALAIGLLLATGDAHAYDLSRIDDSKASGNEHVFIDGLFGIWLPGPSTFDYNHTTSMAFGAELGVTFLNLPKHQLLGIGGFSYSPQTLEPHLIEEKTDMVQGFVGVRYVPGVTCLAGGAGCAFVEVSLGLTWDTAEEEAGHSAPAGELTVNLGAGYRFNLGPNFHLGARIDMGYLQENYTRQVGWFIPSAFAGVSF